MAKRAVANFDDLPPAVRKQVLQSQGRQRAPRRTTFTINQVRTYAVRAMQPLADLTPDQRKRVLEHALRMNEI